MTQLAWKSLFTSFFMIILFMNIALAFDMLEFLNPTGNMSIFSSGDYYFGITSFVEAFEKYFGEDSTIINRFQETLTTYGYYIRKVWDLRDFQGLFPQGSAWEIISALIAILTFINSVVPVLMLVVYALMYVAYILLFAFYTVFFIFKILGGYYVTPVDDPYGIGNSTDINLTFSVVKMIVSM